MFLFARKTRTPISTYTDSYRPPSTLKKTFEDPPLALWSENKFITQDQGRGVFWERPLLGKMFVFAHKTDTPISTYTESYRAPRVTKENYQEPSLRIFEENSRLAKGLTVPRVDHPVDQNHLEKMVKKAVQEYSYATWRTGPYNSAAWNRYTTYLPRIPRVTPDRFDNLPCGEEGVDMLDILPL
ncbi:hypothetical protein JD844_008096 [Phrynosoma platyrhinos]|uniref:Uncharacterized protein n=1 Tax=Phrynosoma platyrhinos TaxID=52577 RepID=A0ABQ7TE37_PHRPL|nr:hypothetical protein JD844_008096 [Phrynosoma platyrhinos]